MKSAWKRFRILMSVLWLSCLIVSLGSVVSAATTLNPTDDATVTVTSPDSPDNGADLGVQGQYSGGTCNSTFEAYLEVDLSGVGTAITSATLTLRSTYIFGADLTMGVFGSTDDSWQESTVTWNTKPTLLGTTLSTASLTAAGSDVIFNSTQDFVDFLEGQRTGDGTATLGIVATDCSEPSVTQSMSSKEGSVAPKLDLSTPPTAITLSTFRGTSASADCWLNWAGLGLLALVVGGLALGAIRRALPRS